MGGDLDGERSTATPQNRLRQFLVGWGGIAAVTIGFIPLMVVHLVGLLQREHYQFLVLLPVGLWVLFLTLPETSDEDSGKITEGQSRWTAVIALLLAMLGLGAAVYLWSPWITALSSVFAVVALVLWQGGRALLSRVWPLIVLFLLVIPPPFGLDDAFIVYLRGITTRLSSSVLDQTGLLHQSYANVIQLPGQSLFVADACSGIQSFYVLLASSLFLCLATRRSLIHSMILLASTFALVIVENTLRIVSVAWASQSGMDWSRGTNHQLLGFVLFAFSILVILSTDQLLLFGLPELRFRKRRTRPMKYKDNVSKQGEPHLFVSWLWMSVVAIFPFLGLAQLPNILASPPQISRLFRDEPELPFFGEDALPEEWHGLRRISYEEIERVAGDPFGQSSQRWFYRDGDFTVGVSLDYPYPGSKDLCQCYEMIGWDISSQTIVSDETTENSPRSHAPNAFAKAQIHRDLFGSGLLLFSSMDLSGRPSVLLKPGTMQTAVRGAMTRLDGVAAGNGEASAGESGEPPFVQFSLLATGFGDWDQSQLDRVETIFLESRERLRKQTMAEIGNPLAGSGEEGQ